jgi:uncharacterized protein (PEP-CTERM system associated)
MTPPSARISDARTPRARRSSASFASNPLAAALVGSALAVAPAHALAQTWRLQPSLAAQLTYTTNADLTAAQRSDWVMQLTPTLVVNERSARTSLSGTISAPILLYARTSENDDVQPLVNLSGSAELYPHVLFVDASAQVSREYVSPFGPRPTNLANATNNAYTAQSYSIAPYTKGTTASGLTYELRDTNIWSDATNATTTQGVGSRAYTNEVAGNLTRPPAPLGWALEYDRQDTRFSRQDPFVTEVTRGRGLWQPDPQWQLSASIGYEDERYPLTHFSGTIYGAGVKWRPTERTSMDADLEHRFFGPSYHVHFDHRTPLAVWSFVALRDITSYPQQLASLPGQGNVSNTLNALFASRIVDPIARQSFVDQLIRERGLPTTLTGPLSLFSQQITLQESLQGTLTLLGARNSVLITVFHTRSEPIENGTFAIVGVLPTSQIDNTQTGTSAVWTHQLTALLRLAVSADWVRSVANDSSGERSRQATLQSIISAPLSALTDVFAGARYLRFDSNLQADFDEKAVFVGINHRFH